LVFLVVSFPLAFAPITYTRHYLAQKRIVLYRLTNIYKKFNEQLVSSRRMLLKAAVNKNCGNSDVPYLNAIQFVIFIATEVTYWPE
jgi:ABC-type transport system involved in Fe-S cluster assembly fused permease/ATPase subunit